MSYLPPVGSGSLPTEETLFEKGDPVLPILSLEEALAKKVASLVEPFFKRLQLIQTGDPLTAIKMKPSGIWRPNAYAKALVDLGPTSIPVWDREHPAYQLHAKLRDTNVFYKPLGDLKFWDHVHSLVSVTFCDYHQLQMQNGVEPSEAFRSFQTRLSFLSSDAILDLAIYLTILDHFGDTRFNEVVGQWRQEAPIVIGGALNVHRNKFIGPVGPDLSSNELPPLQTGDAVILNQHPHYKTKHPSGEEIDPCFTCVGKTPDDKPLLTSLGYDPEGEPLEQIVEKFRLQYNHAPIDPNIIASKTIVNRLNPDPLKNQSKYILLVNGKQVSVTIQELEKGAKGFGILSVGLSRMDCANVLPQVQKMQKTQKAEWKAELTSEEFSAETTLFQKRVMRIKTEEIHRYFAPPLPT